MSCLAENIYEAKRKKIEKFLFLFATIGEKTSQKLLNSLNEIMRIFEYLVYSKSRRNTKNVNKRHISEEFYRKKKVDEF